MVIPCYFANEDLLDMTVACLNSIQAPVRIILIDDGSPFQLDLVKHKINPPYAIVVKKENGGYAKAVNTGLKLTKSEIIIISNNDIVFEDGWFEALMGLFPKYDIGSIRTEEQETVDAITENDKFGSLWAMKREVYNKLGGLDENFGRGYFEDLDYHVRALKAGFKIGKSHRARVNHRGRATFKVVDNDNERYNRNKAYFEEKHGNENQYFS